MVRERAGMYLDARTGPGVAVQAPPRARSNEPPHYSRSCRSPGLRLRAELGDFLVLKIGPAKAYKKAQPGH